MSIAKEKVTKVKKAVRRKKSPVKAASGKTAKKRVKKT